MERYYSWEYLKSRDFIRLVTLLPGTEDKPLHVELHTYHLDRAPPFDALSYVWELGAGLDDFVICGGYETIVSSFICHILRFLRHARPLRPLWIHTISIDQRKTSEYGVSPGSLSHIYQAAVRTLCCVLHENIQPLRDLISHTRKLRLYQRAGSYISQGRDIFSSNLKIAESDLQDFQDSLNQDQYLFDKNKVEKFLQQPYFNRSVS